MRYSKQNELIEAKIAVRIAELKVLCDRLSLKIAREQARQSRARALKWLEAAKKARPPPSKTSVAAPLARQKQGLNPDDRR